MFFFVHFLRSPLKIHVYHSVTSRLWHREGPSRRPKKFFRSTPKGARPTELPFEDDDPGQEQTGEVPGVRMPTLFGYIIAG